VLHPLGLSCEKWWIFFNTSFLLNYFNHRMHSLLPGVVLWYRLCLRMGWGSNTARVKLQFMELSIPKKNYDNKTCLRQLPLNAMAHVTMTTTLGLRLSTTFRSLKALKLLARLPLSPERL
jgi:hypothetical protein